jgi:hypothetical protein
VCAGFLGGCVLGFILDLRYGIGFVWLWLWMWKRFFNMVVHQNQLVVAVFNVLVDVSFDLDAKKQSQISFSLFG